MNVPRGLCGVSVLDDDVDRCSDFRDFCPRTPNQTVRIKLEAYQADHNDRAICRASIEPVCEVRV